MRDKVEPMTVHGHTLDSFTVQYLATALWSTNDESTPQGGEPFDARFSVSDFSNAAVLRAVFDCVGFQLNNSELLNKAYATGIEASTAGHDFWLTRNRHGAGFWDGDYPEEVGDKLTAAAHKYGEVDLYENNGEVEFA